MTRAISWTTDADRLLGTLSDQKVAQRLGCSRQAVSERRSKLRVPSFQPGRPRWTRMEDELLGTMPDQRLARRLKRGVESVAARRAAKGIRIFNPKHHRWTAADDKLLAERPAGQVALFLGISRSAVLHRRSRLGIAPPGGRIFTPPKPWQPDEDALLGTATDVELAPRLGRTALNVRRRRQHLGIPSYGFHWMAKADALLGKMPDMELARQLSVTRKSVARRREGLGIPVCRAGTRARRVDESGAKAKSQTAA